MPDYTVVRRGSDTSGRPLFASRYMWQWWDQVCDVLGFEPTIVQGAHMARAGGGASASAGYHDQGGCFDLRVWDRTPTEVDQIIRVTRRHGAGSWVRDAQRGGFDPHIHLVLGADSPLASGAAWQWSEYVEGNDGLASRGADYHWRPRPLVLTPPEDTLSQYADQLARIEKQNARIEKNQELILKRLDAGAVIRTRLERQVKQGRADRRDLEELLELVKGLESPDRA